MKKRTDIIGIIILLILFVTFYFVTSTILNNLKKDQTIENNNLSIEEPNINYTKEIAIVNKLYQDVRILYDVVNNKFKVDQDDIIISNDITYKRITNFNEIVDNLFTKKGYNKYITDLGSYFAITSDKYYLAGNLVSYQTYYFRGDNTNIYIIDANNEEINAIIYEKWTSNNKNTLATIKVVYTNDKWLIDNISILSTE